MIILTSKIVLPRRTRGLIARERLERLVTQVQEHRITLVKAPPGYGKSTLGRAWADHLTAGSQNVAWLGLDPCDDEPARLAFYMAAALRRCCPTVGSASQELAVTASPPEDILSPLLNELTELDESVFLIIDDFHHLQSAPALQCLDFFLRNAPPMLCVVLLGRMAPAITLTHAAGYGGVFELGATELLFTLPETLALVEKQRTHNCRHRPEDVKLLHDISKGWAAALRVLLLLLTHKDNSDGHLQRIASSNRTIAQLIGDLLDHLSPDLSSLLEQISIPDRLCASLVRAMTGTDDAQKRLELIETMQLFLSPIDEEGRWYAFHPLFREHLESRLRRLQAAEVQRLHLSAGLWFATQGMHRNAVRHALAAGHITQALVWIEACAMQLIESGDMLTLIDWERQLQAHDVAIPLRLRMALAWAHSMVMAGDEGPRWLADVETELRDNPTRDPGEQLKWECKALRATLLCMDDHTEDSRQLAQECLTHARDSGNFWLAAGLSSALAYALSRECRWAEMYAVAPHSAFQVGDARYEMLWAYRLWIQAGAERTQGNLAEARALLDDAMSLVNARRDETNPRSVPSSHAIIRSLSHCMTSDLHYLQNRIAEAGRHSAEAIEVVRIAGSLEAVRLAFCVGARVAAHEGNRMRARALLGEAEAIAHRRRWPRLTTVVLAERARLALCDGRRDEALGHEIRLNQMIQSGELTSTQQRDARLQLALLQSWLALHLGDSARAVHLSAPSSTEARGLNLRLLSASLEATHALALDMNGQRPAALAALRQSCEDVMAGNALRSLLDIPVCAERLQALVADAQVDAPVATVAFLQKLAAAAPSSVPVEAFATATTKLSTRECQILRLVCEGGSNKKIGRVLGVAPDTVKYHMKNIFAKLGVDSRAEAAAMAARIDLTVHRSEVAHAH